MHLPIINWLPNYPKKYWRGDIAAGITVAIMLIPQGMAYAMIAGLPPVYGLYASIVPQIIYALFGTSRQLAVGPVAMDSLIVAAGVSAIAEAGSQYYISMAILLALIMGVIQVILGLTKAGFLVKYLSRPVIIGFTNAAAFIIAVNQIKYLLGVSLKRGDVTEIIIEAVHSYSKYNWPTVLISVAAILILVILKKLNNKIPSALVVVGLGTLAVLFGKWNELGVSIVQGIPEGLPSFKVPSFDMRDLSQLAPTALTLALIAFMESISVAKAIQEKHKEEYKLDNNQELIGLGMGNIIGAFFQCYPTTGGFSRSAVNNDAGANTNLAAIISAVLIGVTLLFLTSWFYYLPHAVLGSIIVVAVLGLVKFKEIKSSFQLCKLDFALIMITFLITLGFGITPGILIGVMISIALEALKRKYPDLCNKSYHLQNSSDVN